jgi:hypothetical protein
MAILYTNLTAPTNTASGISEFFLIAQASDFVEGGIKCPAAPVDGDPAGLSVKITEPHEFQAGRGFAKIVCAPEKNSLDAKTIGDLLFQKLDFELKVFIPGSYAELHEQAGQWINKQLIVLTKDSNCQANMWYQLGCDCTFAYLKVDFSTGTTKDGVKGYSGTVTWQNAFVQLYTHVDGPEILV